MLTILLVLTGIAFYATIGYGIARLRMPWHCRRTLDTLHYESRPRQRRDVKIFFLLLMGLWPVSLPVSLGHQAGRWVVGLNWKKPSNPFQRVGGVINTHLDPHIDAVLDSAKSS